MIKIDSGQGVDEGQQSDLPEARTNEDSSRDKPDSTNNVSSSQDVDLTSLQETFCTSMTISGDAPTINDPNDSWPSEAYCDKPQCPVQISDPALQLISDRTYPTNMEGGQQQLVSVSRHSSSWNHYNHAGLVTMPLTEICTILQHLHSKIEEVSAELVVLLQERQRLRDEVGIRNIAIEQLLKLQERLQWRLTEPLAVQMSVVFPPDENEALDCK